MEITESVFAESNTIVKRYCGPFPRKGFYVLMDDFGSGYSSLNVLKTLECRLSETRFEIHARSMQRIKRKRNSDSEIYRRYGLPAWSCNHRRRC